MKSIDARRALGLILLGVGLLLAAIYLAGRLNRSAQSASAPQPNYGPLVPTSIGAALPAVPAYRSNSARSTTAAATVEQINTSGAPTSDATLVPAATTAAASTSFGTARATSTLPRSAPTLTATPVPVFSAALIVPGAYSPRQRAGVSVVSLDRAATPLGKLRPGWYLDWTTSASPAHTGSAEFAQMVRVPRGEIVPDLKTIAQIAQKNPGALWLIGNEMDVIWQDNATPEQYVAAYHEIYNTLKQADPASRVAIGGVSEPSSLRLQYLDRVLQAYRERYGRDMPIDVWNVHNFILPEQRGSWGVDIPPGINATSGLMYSIQDHDNLNTFKQQLVDFRRWMAQRGYRDKELIVSEYGVLMYADYGFDYPRVRDFMLGSFDVMLNTTDAAVGLPADGNRLVQRWCWYSLADVGYPTGNLADPNTGELTPLGEDYKAYLDRYTP